MNQIHWENVYTMKATDTVSWFQPHAEKSLRIIESLKVGKEANIIDVGGGASILVDDLLAQGYQHLNVLDLSASALKVAQKRLGESAKKVNWLVEDVTQLKLEKHSIDVWHDRAVFHFLTDELDRQRYVEAVLKAVKPSGFVIVATFAEDGPKECSGLPVQGYSAEGIHDEFGSPFELLGHEKESHQTPSGAQQKFVYCYCRKKSN
ncbi:MAG TPA: class I SAM-dependent methyltransferase [Leucothrix sp.]|nr:class I SAM-dependent methyltransferase [Leucothrix sp.]